MREIDGNYILKVNEFGCKKIKGEKFKDDEDLTSFEIVFYQGVCDEEISREEMILSDKK